MTVCLSLLVPNYLAILATIAIAGGLCFIVAGFELLARRRSVLATPTCPIDSAPPGLVEVIGKAAGPHTMAAPVSGKHCFLYHTTAWQQYGDKKNWEKVADETLHLPFFIDDSTGQLLIEPLGADLDLPPDFREEYDASLPSLSREGLPPRITAFLFRHGIVPGRRLRIEERSIQPGDELFVTGTLAENPGVPLRPFSPSGETIANGGHRDGPSDSESERFLQPIPAPKVIRLSEGAPLSLAREMSQQGKIAAALTRAGITKPEAWSAAGVSHQTAAAEQNAPPAARSESRLSELREAGGRAADQNFESGIATNFVSNSVSNSVSKSASNTESKQDQPRLSGFSRAPSVVLMKGAKDSTFVISFHSQKEFVVGIGWKSAALIWGGAAITLLGAYTLFA